MYICHRLIQQGTVFQNVLVTIFHFVQLLLVSCEKGDRNFGLVVQLVIPNKFGTACHPQRVGDEFE